MTNTPSSRPPPGAAGARDRAPRPEPELEEATAIDFGMSRAQADPEEDGQETLIWDGAAQLAQMEAQLAEDQETRAAVRADELIEHAAPAGEPTPQPFVDPRVWFLGR